MDTGVIAETERSEGHAGFSDIPSTGSTFNNYVTWIRRVKIFFIDVAIYLFIYMFTRTRSWENDKCLRTGRDTEGLGIRDVDDVDHESVIERVLQERNQD